MSGLQLFCLAYAGGTATTAYASLKAHLSPEVEVIPLDLPGRTAPSQTFPASVDELIEKLYSKVQEQASSDWGVLGHSYGGALAFEIALRAERDGHPAKVCLISGRRGPQGHPRNHEHKPSDEELLTQVAEWGALPPEFLSHPALRELAARRLRQDFDFSEELHGRDPVRLEHTPLRVLAGRNDPVAPPISTKTWSRRTSADFSFEVMEGDHFFLFNGRSAHNSIANSLRRLAQSSPVKG